MDNRRDTLFRQRILLEENIQRFTGSSDRSAILSVQQQAINFDAARVEFNTAWDAFNSRENAEYVAPVRNWEQRIARLNVLQDAESRRLKDEQKKREPDKPPPANLERPKPRIDANVLAREMIEPFKLPPRILYNGTLRIRDNPQQAGEALILGLEAALAGMGAEVAGLPAAVILGGPTPRQTGACQT